MAIAVRHDRVLPDPVKVLSNVHFRPYSAVYAGLAIIFDACDNLNEYATGPHELNKTTITIA